MKLHEALESAPLSINGARFAIATPFPDVTFIGAAWPRGFRGCVEVRVRGHRFDDKREIVESWDVADPDGMTIDFKPLA